MAVVQLNEALEREKKNRRAYDEGKDEIIFDLEKRWADAVDQLTDEKSRKKQSEGKNHSILLMVRCIPRADRVTIS